MAFTEDERAAIERHLYECEPAGGMQYQSSLIAILGDARGATDRDGEGRVKPNRRSQSWLGATAYLIMLDQVGKTFKVNGKPDRFVHPIGLAISHFTPVQDKAIIEALYALRCALAHDYSLFNRDKHGTQPMRDHAFNFKADPVSPLVEFPSTRWNRIYKDPPLEQTTVVNLRKVGDLGETVVGSLRKHHREETLGLRLPLDEFEWRYGMLFRLGSARLGSARLGSARLGSAMPRTASGPMARSRMGVRLTSRLCPVSPPRPWRRPPCKAGHQLRPT